MAVEYVELDVGQPQLSVGGHPFDICGTPIPEPQWSLPVWLHAQNPDGIFTARKPEIHCP
ncbi:hypothetical protein BH23GEM9_BH23GEM9_26670 [soil metagenome]